MVIVNLSNNLELVVYVVGVRVVKILVLIMDLSLIIIVFKSFSCCCSLFGILCGFSGCFMF